MTPTDTYFRFLVRSRAVYAVYWTHHLREAVQFSSGVGQLRQDENALLLEVGPGGVLTTLARQHPAKSDDQLVISSLGDGSSQTSECVAIQQALGQLWLGGIEPDWKKFHAEAKRSRVSLPKYPFERKRFWLDASSSANIGTQPIVDKAQITETISDSVLPTPEVEPQNGPSRDELEFLIKEQLQAMNQVCALQLAFLRGDGQEKERQT